MRACVYVRVRACVQGRGCVWLWNLSENLAQAGLSLSLVTSHPAVSSWKLGKSLGCLLSSVLRHGEGRGIALCGECWPASVSTRADPRGPGESTFHVCCFITSPPQPWRAGLTVISVLQMGTLRHRELGPGPWWVVELRFELGSRPLRGHMGRVRPQAPRGCGHSMLRQSSRCALELLPALVSRGACLGSVFPVWILVPRRSSHSLGPA